MTKIAIYKHFGKQLYIVPYDIFRMVIYVTLTILTEHGNVSLFSY